MPRLLQLVQYSDGLRICSGILPEAQLLRLSDVILPQLTRRKPSYLISILLIVFLLAISQTKAPSSPFLPSQVVTWF